MAPTSDVPLTFVVVRTRDGAEDFHIRNIHDIELAEGETIVAEREIRLTGEEAQALRILAKQMRDAMPSEQLPDDALEALLTRIFKEGRETNAA